MYDAACQLARGSREYLQTDYFYNWAYQTGFVAYEALVVRLFGEGLLPLQVLNAVWMAGTAAWCTASPGGFCRRQGPWRPLCCTRCTRGPTSWPPC